jgi:CRISPR/Cas system-associated protein Csm6
MPNLIITSVGTSFTLVDEWRGRNLFEGIEDDKLNEMRLDRIDFWEKVEKNENYQQTVETWKEKIRENLARSKNTAEIDSLMAISHKQVGDPPQLLANFETDYVLLLTSDTYLGKYAADVTLPVVKSEILAGENKEQRIWPATVPKLNFNPDGEIDTGEGFFAELVESFSDTINQAQTDFNGKCSQGGRVIFNVTGGFKGSVPFLTIIADRRKARMVYLFEGTNNLVVINFEKKGAEDDRLSHLLENVREV